MLFADLLSGFAVKHFKSQLSCNCRRDRKLNEISQGAINFGVAIFLKAIKPYPKKLFLKSYFYSELRLKQFDKSFNSTLFTKNSPSEIYSCCLRPILVEHQGKSRNLGSV